MSTEICQHSEGIVCTDTIRRKLLGCTGCQIDKGQTCMKCDDIGDIFSGITGEALAMIENISKNYPDEILAKKCRKWPNCKKK